MFRFVTGYDFRPLAARDGRRGTVLVLAAFILTVVLAFVAFGVDIGYIALTRSNLQNAADAAALAAGYELEAGFLAGAAPDPLDVADVARAAASGVAAANAAGNHSSVYVNESRDLRFGRRTWDESTEGWVETWGTPPYNMAEVTVRRDQGTGSQNSEGDEPLPLFFATAIGYDTASLKVSAAAALLPGGGFRIVEGRNAMVLPITVDLETWEQVLAGHGEDNYAYDESRGEVIHWKDEILEFNLYPDDTNLPSGNRGTVDFGSRNNSTADLKRQIMGGLSPEDLAYFGGELRVDEGPLTVNGDTGLSAGIENALQSIRGQVRAIPVFSHVGGNGNNAMFTIIKFVGIRILDVELGGNQKHVIVQPATFVDSTVIVGKVPLDPDSIFAPVRLVH